jgi:hypothetical protein
MRECGVLEVVIAKEIQDIINQAQLCYRSHHISHITTNTRHQPLCPLYLCIAGGIKKQKIF